MSSAIFREDLDRLEQHLLEEEPWGRRVRLFGPAPIRYTGRDETREDRPMTADAYPLQVLLVTLAGWVNRHQQHVIEYLVEENRVLKEQVKGRRLRLTDDQRRRLAAKGRRLGRRVLRQVATLVTPDTILRWRRQLIARTWTVTPTRPGRPGIMQELQSPSSSAAETGSRSQRSSTRLAVHRP